MSKSASRVAVARRMFNNQLVPVNPSMIHHSNAGSQLLMTVSYSKLIRQRTFVSSHILFILSQNSPIAPRCLNARIISYDASKSPEPSLVHQSLFKHFNERVSFLAIRSPSQLRANLARFNDYLVSSSSLIYNYYTEMRLNNEQ